MFHSQKNQLCFLPFEKLYVHHSWWNSCIFSLEKNVYNEDWLSFTSVYLSFYNNSIVSLSIFLPVFLHVCLHLFYLCVFFICLFIYLSIKTQLFLCPFFFLSFCTSVYISFIFVSFYSNFLSRFRLWTFVWISESMSNYQFRFPKYVYVQPTFNFKIGKTYFYFQTHFNFKFNATLRIIF